MKKEIRTEWVVITPDLAKQYLALSKGNRPISKDRVDAYARDMESGNWETCGQPIVIDEDGVLKDGHHRLNAIIKAEAMITMLVVIGVPADAKNYDVGKPRSTRDIFKYGAATTYDWESDSKTIAIAKFHFAIINKLRFPTNEEVLAFIHRNMDEMAWIVENTYKKYSKALTASIAWMNKAPLRYAIFCALKSGVPKDKLQQFVIGLQSGQKLSPAMIRFRDELMTVRMANNQNRLQVLYGCENAINDFIHDVDSRYGGYKIGCPIKTGNEKKSMLQPVFSNNEMLKYA